MKRIQPPGSNFHMLTNHIYICLGFLVLGVPIYLLDRAVLKGGGGNWISLDLRGLFIKWYSIFAVTQICVSSLGFTLLNGWGLATIHLMSALLSIVITTVAFFTYARYEDYVYKKRHAAKIESRKKIINVIELKSWQCLPDDRTPNQIVTRIKVSQSGRFAGSVYAYTEGDTPMLIFQSTDTAQRKVKAGDEFDFIFSIVLSNKGVGEDIELRFHLFKNEYGPSAEDISKVYKKKITREDDGTYFYGTLP